MMRGARWRILQQANLVWADKYDPVVFVERGDFGFRKQPASYDPAVGVALDQIKRDGGQLIPEHVEEAVRKWQEATSKPAEPT